MLAYKTSTTNLLTHKLFLNCPNLPNDTFSLTVLAAASQSPGVPAPRRRGADLHTTPASGHRGHRRRALPRLLTHPLLWPNVLFDLSWPRQHAERMSSSSCPPRPSGLSPQRSQFVWSAATCTSSSTAPSPAPNLAFGSGDCAYPALFLHFTSALPPSSRGCFPPAMPCRLPLPLYRQLTVHLFSPG